MKHQMIKDENTQLLLLPCRDALPNAFFYTTFVHAHLFHDQVPLCVIWNGYILHIASDSPKSCDTSRMRYSGTPENQPIGGVEQLVTTSGENTSPLVHQPITHGQLVARPCMRAGGYQHQYVRLA